MVAGAGEAGAGEASAAAAGQIDTTPWDATSQRIIAVGVFLFVANVGCAIAFVDSWPFSRFPQFTTVHHEPTGKSYEYAIRGIDQETRVFHPQLWPGNLLLFQPRNAAQATDKARDARWRGLIELMIQEGADIKPGETFEVYELTRSTLPGEWDQPPLDRRLVYSITN